MKPWAVGFAGLFKERDNPELSGITVATVISPLPNISVSLTDEILLDQDVELILASRIYELDLRVGEKVILVPAVSGQSFYIIDKVGN